MSKVSSYEPRLIDVSRADGVERSHRVAGIRAFGNGDLDGVRLLVPRDVSDRPRRDLSTGESLGSPQMIAGNRA